MSRFENKVVIITGAGGGIGSETAKKLYSEGATLVLVDLKKESVDKVIAENGFAADRILVLTGDVSKQEDVVAYVNATVERFSKIDAFFNNAGVEGSSKPFEEYTKQDFDFVFGINVYGVLYGMQEVYKVMKKQGYGSIVNTSSLAGLMGSPGTAVYNTSKHAVLGLTRCAALEGAPIGVRVNSVHPGVIATGMMTRIENNVAPGAAEQAHEAYTAAVPMKRFGTPEEVANVAAFLLSDESSYVTGSAYTVDGGLIYQ